jgi:ferric-dicitrate binding protein FerR (iron transport regulator)
MSSEKLFKFKITVEEQNIRALLAKCATGYIPSVEEQKLLEDWYDAFPEHDELTFVAATDKYRIKDEIKQEIFNRLGLEVPVFEPAHIRRKRFVFPELVKRVAAALVILISVGGAWIYFSKEDKIPAVKYVTVTAPPGKENLVIHLSDSSTVWLHSGSTLKYPEHFAKNKREIELVDGMAFFDVKHDDHTEFIVHAPGGIDTRVLGTRFNIKGYRNLPDVEISLVKGSVSVLEASKQLALLKPNQQLRYTKATAQNKLLEVNPVKYTSWLKGNTVLENATFDEVALTLKDVYNVPVLYNQQELAALRFNVQFNNTLSLTQVLNLLRDISSIDYKVTQNGVTVMKE